MKAQDLYDRLDKDFDVAHSTDFDWPLDYNEYVNPKFKERQNGILLDNSQEIKEVYTSVFPSNYVLELLLDMNKCDVLLFTHHAMVWDIRKAPEVFCNINLNLLPILKEERVSVYALHLPLDVNGPYSTSINLAKAVGVEPQEDFCDYFGKKVAVFGKTNLKTASQMVECLSQAVGHRSKLWLYGDETIKDSRVAVAAGGGCQDFVIEEIVQNGINLLVTGVTALNKYSEKAHSIAKQHGVNIIGGTHYSTEKFACIAMCDYFNGFGLFCKFLEDKFVLEDLE